MNLFRPPFPKKFVWEGDTNLWRIKSDCNSDGYTKGSCSPSWGYTKSIHAFNWGRQKVYEVFFCWKGEVVNGFSGFYLLVEFGIEWYGFSALAQVARRVRLNFFA